MEPVGLALGVVGLAGLFSTCLDAVERFESWRNFKGDSRLVQTLVQGQKLRLKRWGHAVGIDLGVVSARHHHALDDPQMLAMIRMDLLEIQSICTNVDSKLPNAIDAKVEKVHGLESSATPRSSVFPDSKRRRMKWALGDKAKFTTQTQTLASLVQNLHDLVPVETGDSLQPNLDVNSIDSVDGSSLLKDPWTTELKQILTRLDVATRKDIHAWLLGNYTPIDRYETALLSKRDLLVLSIGFLHETSCSTGALEIFPKAGLKFCG